MFAVLLFSFNAIAPILLMILLGYYGRQSGMLDHAALKKINRFNFRFGFFALMFMNLYNIESVQTVPWNLILFMLAAFTITTLTGWVLAQFLTTERSRKAVLIMALFRSNYAIVGLVLVDALAPGKTETAVVMQLPVVLYFNLISTLVLSAYAGTEQHTDWLKTFRELASNPLIQGLLCGGLVLLVRQCIPLNEQGIPVFSLAENLPWLHTALTWLNRMATPLALIVLGGQLEPGESALFRKELIAGVTMRLILCPIIGFSLAGIASALHWISPDAGAYAMMTAAFGSPMAVASVVMSAEMGSDDKLCGQIVVWTAICGMFTMFIITAILRALGLVG